jgi:hypothetical protein
MDALVNPISFNDEALRILSYPDTVPNESLAAMFVAGKIHASLMSRHASRELPFVTEFLSGRRRYLCRIFRVDSLIAGPCGSSIGVLFVRRPPSDAKVLHPLVTSG